MIYSHYFHNISSLNSRSQFLLPTPQRAFHIKVAIPNSRDYTCFCALRSTKKALKQALLSLGHYGPFTWLVDIKFARRFFDSNDNKTCVVLLKLQFVCRRPSESCNSLIVAIITNGFRVCSLQTYSPHCEVSLTQVVLLGKFYLKLQRNTRNSMEVSSLENWIVIEV